MTVLEVKGTTDVKVEDSYVGGPVAARIFF